MSRIETRKLRTGTTYRVKWRKGGAQMNSPAFDTRQEAEDYKTVLDAEEVTKGERRNVAKPRTPFHLFAAEWLAGRPVTDRSHTTRGRESACIRHHLNPFFGDMPIGEIGRADLQRWVNDMEKKRKGKTVQDYYQTLSQILRDAALEGYLPNGTPAVKGRVSLPPADKRMVFLDDDELEKFLTVAAEVRPADYAMIHVAAHTGMRQGELIGLRRETVVLDADPHIKVVKGAKRGVDGLPVLGSTKTLQWRHVALYACCVDILRQQLTAHDFALVFPAKGGRGRPAGGIEDATNWRKRAWYPVTKAAARPELHFHDLRHSHTASLLAAGWDVNTVAERLGHASPKMTLDVYGHVAIGRQHDLLRQKGIRPAAPRTDILPRGDDDDPYSEACEECGAVPGRACFNLEGSGFLRQPHAGR